jgi:zinc/manganese transport system permease protein
MAMVIASALGVATVWLGILLAYDSYDWPPRHQGWPVSFFVVTLVFSFYLVVHVSVGRFAGHRPDPVSTGAI